MARIEVTRAEFEEHFGIKTDPSSLGMAFYGQPTGSDIIPQPLAEYVFIDESMSSEAACEVAELKRMFRL